MSDRAQQTMAVWSNLLRAHGRITDQIDRDLIDGADMTLAEFEVLDHLAAADGRVMRMNELADRVRLSPSGLTRRFDTLVRRGWVAREPCDDDRRGINARITAAGLQHFEAAESVHRDGVHRYMLDHLSRSELDCLLGALGRLAELNEVSPRREPASR
jgi:DNA-binding MarR family transcriptional regulator